MKKIVEYRKLLNVDKTVDLKDLKTIYRNAMKDAHPDKFQGDDAGLKAAEENSKQIIEAYDDGRKAANDKAEKETAKAEKAAKKTAEEAVTETK